jgi:hypothetical protein
MLDAFEEDVNAGLIPTRAISLTGPWWWFMLHLPPEWLKRVENRSPGFSHRAFRGACWVHAAKGLSRSDFGRAMLFARDDVGVPDAVLALIPSFEELPRGGIVGRFDVTDYVHANTAGAIAFELQRWRMRGQSVFVVEDAKPVDFVACKGALGFWRVPLDILRKVAAQ